MKYVGWKVEEIGIHSLRYVIISIPL